MVRCKICGMDSVDLQWKNEELNDQNPPKWRLYLGDLAHICHPKKNSREEFKMVFCPKCNPETRKKMPANKLQEHIKKEHLGFW
jgi:hypothetical protein